MFWLIFIPLGTVRKYKIYLTISPWDPNLFSAIYLIQMEKEYSNDPLFQREGGGGGRVQNVVFWQIWIVRLKGTKHFSFKF